MALIVALIASANMAGVGFIWRDQKMRVYREREEWLRHIANETPAYLWMTAPDGENSFINKPLAEFIGTDKESLGNNWKIYFHPDDADRVFERFFQCVANRSEFLDEHRLRRFDGEYRWFIGKGLPRFSRQGEFLGHAGSLFDITARRIAEQSARENAELLQGQNRVLELISKNTPLQETLDALVRVLEALSPDMLGSVLLLDPDGLHLRHGAAPSLPEAYNRAIDGEPIGPTAGSCGSAAFRGEPVIVEDIATDPLWEHYRDFALQYGLRACWSTPIFEERERQQKPVLGTFALYFRSPGFPLPGIGNSSKWPPKLRPSRLSEVVRPRRCARARSGCASRPPAAISEFGNGTSIPIGSPGVTTSRPYSIGQRTPGSSRCKWCLTLYIRRTVTGSKQLSVPRRQNMSITMLNTVSGSVMGRSAGSPRTVVLTTDLPVILCGWWESRAISHPASRLKKRSTGARPGW